MSSRLLIVLNTLSRAKCRHPASLASAVSSWICRRRGNGCGAAVINGREAERRGEPSERAERLSGSPAMLGPSNAP